MFTYSIENVREHQEICKCISIDIIITLKFDNHHLALSFKAFYFFIIIIDVL